MIFLMYSTTPIAQAVLFNSSHPIFFIILFLILENLEPFSKLQKLRLDLKKSD